MIVAPVAAGELQNILGDRVASSSLKGFRTISAAAIAAFAILVAIWLPTVSPLLGKPPLEASARLDALPGRATVLNEYAAGGWLLWSARDVSPSIDGRTEIYSPESFVPNFGP